MLNIPLDLAPTPNKFSSRQIKSSWLTLPDTGWGRISYRMAKTAVNQQTASLAAAFKAQGINVVLVALHPGRVQTRMSGGSGGSGSVNLSQSTKRMIKIVEGLNMETPGRYLDYPGMSMEW